MVIKFVFTLYKFLKFNNKKSLVYMYFYINYKYYNIIYINDINVISLKLNHFIMINKFLKGKVAVFIDASNIYFSQKTLGWKIDFRKLLDYFKSECNLIKISFYSSINPENKKERKFHDFLEIIGYIVKHKEIKFIKNEEEEKFGGHHKGNIDVDLTIDAVYFKDSYDSFVLLSGDGDFESLIKFLKSYNKYCLVISTKDHVSIELIRQAKFIDFKKLRNEIELK